MSPVNVTQRRPTPFVADSTREERAGLPYWLRELISRTTAERPKEIAEEKWLGGRDSNPDNGVQSAVSYR